MADNSTLPATGDVIAADDIGGVKYQRTKVTYGDDGSATDVSATNQLPTALYAENVGTWPGYSGPAVAGTARLGIDDDGAAITRGAVLTDEGTFRCNFANSSTAVAIGSVTVSGAVVTGSGFLTSDIHYGDYFKVAADADTAYVQVKSIDSDTRITLVSSYVGSASGTGNRSIMLPYTGSGGSLSVASGQLTLASGTTDNAITGVKRFVDYAPLVFRARVSVSQRIANQDIHIGMEEDAATTRWFARFLLTGTTNTTVTCETGRNPTSAPSASETESTAVTLPNGATTATMRDYRVEVLTESVRFYIDGVLVAEHNKVIPAQHDEMICHVEVRNGTGAASTTSVVCDYITGKNHNKLEVGVMSDAEKLVASAPPLVPFTYSQAGVIAINTDLIVIDCLQLRSLYIQCTSMGTTGVVTVQWANDAAFTLPVTATLVGESGTTATSINAVALRATNVMARYCRLRLTVATTAGTTTFNVFGSQNPYTPLITTQTISGTVSVTGYPTAAASADALANPTVTKIDATQLTFNGTTWDRKRGNATGTTGDTGAKTASFNGATQTNHTSAGATIVINMGVVSGTSPTLTAQVQGSADAGTTWYNIPGAVTPSITATGVTVLCVSPGVTPAANAAVSYPLPRTWRLVYTIGGTTPSFTITNVQVAYHG